MLSLIGYWCSQDIGLAGLTFLVPALIFFILGMVLAQINNRRRWSLIASGVLLALSAIMLAVAPRVGVRKFFNKRKPISSIDTSDTRPEQRLRLNTHRAALPRPHRPRNHDVHLHAPCEGVGAQGRGEGEEGGKFNSDLLNLPHSRYTRSMTSKI